MFEFFNNWDKTNHDLSSNIVAFDEGERLLFESRGTSRGYRSGCHAISRFGRHLLTGWNILPRSHVFRFSCPGTGIYIFCDTCFNTTDETLASL